MFRLNMYLLIRFAIQNSRTVHLLGLKEFVNKFKMHLMNNITIDTNIFDKKWWLTDKAITSSFVIGRDIN